MNEKRESGMIMMAAVVWAVVVILLVIMCSCTTKKVVTETNYVHDTLYISHSDTIREVRVETKTVTDTMLIHKKDTVIIDRGQVIVLNENGDTIRQREWNNLIEKVNELISSQHNESQSEKDSVLKHENDSLKQVLKQEHEKQTIKTKPWIQPMDAFLLFLIVCGVCCVCALVSRSSNKKQ